MHPTCAVYINTTTIHHNNRQCRFVSLVVQIFSASTPILKHFSLFAIMLFMPHILAFNRYQNPKEVIIMANRIGIAPFPSFNLRAIPVASPSLLAVRTFTPLELANMSIAGIVKSATSGDCLVLTSVKNPDAEKIVYLAWVNTPVMRKDNEEPWAFATREFLREKLVGKHVMFKPFYQLPNTTKMFGTITAQDGSEYPRDSVAAGLAKVRDAAGRPGEDPEKAEEKIAELRKLESEAREAKKGMWSSESGRIEVKHDLGDANAFVEKYKGKSIDGLVERVLSGDRMIIRLKLSPESHANIMTLVAGIRAPTTERTNPSNGQVQPAEEFGNESKKFVEERLNQRNVKVDVIGLSPQNQLIAVVKHPRHGSIAKHILEAGLARCTDQHSTLLGTEMAPLRKAEIAAQDGKKGLFKGHVAKAGGGVASDATVSKVLSADTIFIRNKAGVEKRISISSIRAPKRNDSAEAPFQDEAKEFLRKKLIGKHVRVSVDGSKAASEGFEAKDVATVMSSNNDKNIGLMIVQEGWCSVIRHKRDDPDRAPNYDELLAAQEKAKEEKKGMWSGKAPSAKTYADASVSVQKAKIHAATLKNKGKMPAIIDFVKSGSRFTVLVPRENLKLNFVLGGIRAPKSARNANEKSEPFGQEAHDFAIRRCNQRDVEIVVSDIDKVGGFIGELFINRESFAKILVEEGLASVHGYSAEAAGNATELFAAEQRAKDAKKNLWKDYDPSQDAVEEFSLPDRSKDAVGDRPKDYRDVQVSYIHPESGKIILQNVGEKRQPLTSVTSSLQTFHKNPANSAALSDPPKVGQLVSAKFSLDGNWYRGKVRSNDRTAKEAEVLYIDWGNTEKVSWSKLRALSPDHQKLKPQCFEAVLSCLELPVGTEYFNAALEGLEHITSEAELVAMVDNVAQDGTISATFYKAEDVEADDPTTTINALMAAEGLAFVSKQLKPWERKSPYLKVFNAAQKEAFDDHRGMWQYGDPTGE